MFFWMAKDVESLTKEDSGLDNKELVDQLLKKTQLECYRHASVRIRARESGGESRQYIGPIVGIDHVNKVISLDEGREIGVVSMGEIVGYEWL